MAPVVTKSRRSNRTLARILEAAGREFSTYGLAEARTERIAESAGINRALLYYYFESKEELFGATLEKLTRQVVDWDKRLFHEDATPGEKIVRKALGHFDRILSLREFQGMMDKELSWFDRGEPNAIPMLVEKVIAPTLEVFRDLVREGVARGELHPIDWMQLHLAVLGANVLYYVNAPIWRMALSIEPFSPESLAERRRRIVEFLGQSIFVDQAHGAEVAARVLADTPMPDLSGKNLLRSVQSKRKKNAPSSRTAKGQDGKR
jgi:TetR/AcrR family transcriptional regulator